MPCLNQYGLLYLYWGILILSLQEDIWTLKIPLLKVWSPLVLVICRQHVTTCKSNVLYEMLENLNAIWIEFVSSLKFHKKDTRLIWGGVKCINCQSVTPGGIDIFHLLMDQLKFDITKSWVIRDTLIDLKSLEHKNISLKIMMKY